MPATVPSGLPVCLFGTRRENFSRRSFLIIILEEFPLAYRLNLYNVALSLHTWRIPTGEIAKVPCLKPQFVDLHTHSSASDGTDDPAALVARAASEGLCAVALTDHDTVSGLPAATAAGEKLGIIVVRGCELAVSTPYGEAHILGLWLPEKPGRLAEALRGIREAREARNREMVDRFRRAGYGLSYPELLAEAAGESVGRPHMASLLVKKGVCANTREAFARFLGDGKPMHVPRALPSPEEGLALLLREGATTVLAHPMLLRAPLSGLDALVGNMAAMGLDALEAHHSEHDAAAARQAARLAERHGLAVSGGSDYHGDLRANICLGRVHGNRRVPRAVYDGLLARRAAKGLP